MLSNLLTNLLETLSILPEAFWVVMILLAGGTFWAVGKLRSGLGLPVIIVLATVSCWYVFDVFYNDYKNTYTLEFSAGVLDQAWWQVALFLVVFLFLVTPIHQSINSRDLRRSSQLFQSVNGALEKPQFQSGLEQILSGCWILWAILSIGAVCRLHFQALYYFCPYLAYLADPWSRGRLGQGLDFVWVVALHFHIFIAAMFGMLLALLRNPKYRAMALLGVITAWPYLLFARTRNYMLAAVIPGILAWVFVRLRFPIVIKILILAALFSVVSMWFNFVMANRSNVAITTAFQEEGVHLMAHSDIHQEGMNMYEELCWINTFIDKGIYKPNGGQRYYAELVNPIPRSIWPNKPLIGIDYARLRGQSYDDASANNAGIGASMSTGMIGQGVVNFGTFFGPSFAAFLMSLWVAILARLDLQGEKLGRLPLYSLGLILTFNLGRDITFITLYTFIFGAVLIELVGLSSGGKLSKTKKVSRLRPRGSPGVPSGSQSEASPTPGSSGHMTSSNLSSTSTRTD